jgi:hypothetical protein
MKSKAPMRFANYLAVVAVEFAGTHPEDFVFRLLQVSSVALCSHCRGSPWMSEEGVRGL